MPAARPGPDTSTAARDARRLSTLLEVSQALSGTLNLKAAAAMQRVLQTLIRHHSVVRGIVTLLRDGERQVEATEGFEDRARTVRFKVGEGITGKVVESGKPIVVPRVSKEPSFLNLMPRRADGAKQEFSFGCVPIMLNRQAVGALAVDLRFKAERDYDSSLKFFGIVSSNIGQALNVQKTVEEERRRLLDENTHLRQELRERYDANIIGTSGSNPPHVRAGRAGGADEHDRADSRRVGDRKGADRPRHPLQLAARQEAVRLCWRKGGAA